MGIARQQAMSQIQTQILQAQPQGGGGSGNTTQPLNQAVPTLDPKQQKAQEKAVANQAKIQAQEYRAGQSALQGASRIARQARQQSIRQAQAITRAFTTGANSTGATIGKVPTPGGIAVPTIILLVLWLSLLPVNGHTRLIWFLMALFGQAKLAGVPVTEGQVFAPAIPGTSLFPKLAGTTTTPPTSPTKTPLSTTTTNNLFTSPPQQPKNATTSLPPNKSLTSSQPVKKHSIVDQLHHTSHAGGL